MNCKNSPLSPGQADLIPAASTSVRAASRSNVDRAEAASFSGACSASDNASEEIMRITFDAQTVEGLHAAMLVESYCSGLLTIPVLVF